MATVKKTAPKAKTAKTAAPKAKASKAKAKSPKAKAAKLDKINKAKNLKEVISSRELKYIYPADCTDPLSRKAFRQKVRAKLSKFDRDLEKVTGKKRSTLSKEFKSYKATVLA
jgi:hypothetical protein